MNDARIISYLWLALGIYWVISAIGSKKNDYQQRGWSRWPGIRILFIAAVAIALVQVHPNRWLMFQNPAVSHAGVALCAAGIAFAIWARTTLGANWSPVPSIKREHELVTTGAYRFVRHPIYAGIWVALVGSALAESRAWLFGLALATAFFAYRVKVEEGLMMRQFPAEYAAYMKRTKAVIPFVL